MIGIGKEREKHRKGKEREKHNRRTKEQHQLE
jgi:hypothetical protein